MTIPFQGLPDTRPGYAFQSPGDVGALGGGIEAVLAALIQRQKLDQENQALGIQQQSVDQMGAWREAQAQQQAAEFAAAQQAALARLMNEREVGGAIQSMTRPEMPVQLPFGALAGQQFNMPPASLGEAVQSVSPENAPEVIKQGQPIQKEKDAQKAAAKAEAAKSAFLKSLPPDLQSAGQLAVLSKDGGISPEIANLLAKEAMTAISPETIKMIAGKHPEWAGLPPEEMVKLFVHEQQQRNEARFRPPPASSMPDLDNVPPGIVTAVRSNEKVIEALEQAKKDLLANPSAIGWVNRIPGLADARDVVEAKKGDITGGITRAATAEAGQLIIYDNTGKQINVEELKRSRQIPTIKDPPSLAIAKIDRMIARAKSAATFMRDAYRPKYGFKPQIQVEPEIPADPAAKRQKMTGITGTFIP